jgi:phosphoglycerol transferase MdoB-like AlkP superfamily enzyme
LNITLKLTAKYLLLPLASIMLFLIVYPKFSLLFGGIGYGLDHKALIDFELSLLEADIGNLFDKVVLTDFKLNNIKLEIFWVTIIYYGFFFILKDNRYRYGLSLLPVILLYLFYDYYFVVFGKAFKFCDISEMPEVIDVLPFWQVAGYISVLLGLIFLLAINCVKLWIRYIFPLFVVITITLILAFTPTLYLSLFKTLATWGATPWSDKHTAQNGYITTLLYFEAMMGNSKAMADEMYNDGIAYETSQKQLTQFLAEKSNARNIHVVILESFFNPGLFTKISYNGPTYDEKFSSLVGNRESAVISPVFGGRTAQAEFEVLCGVPALHKYSSIEFNSFTGEPVFCIPTLLKAAGYRVVATNAYKPFFFNATHAYKGIGFDEAYFPRQYAEKRKTYLSLVDESSQYIFDGDLLEQNLQFVKQHIGLKNQQPLFNYVLGVYGHMPFDIDKKRHPLKLKAQTLNKTLADEYQRAINQIFYRSQALAHYLSQLMELDPQSLIIVMGDHVPILLGSSKFYQQMGYRNNTQDSVMKPSAFYIENGQFVKKEDLHQYDMGDVIFNYITSKHYCQTYPCQKRSQETLTYEYNMIMAGALR